MAVTRCLVGIDLGTSVIKAGVFDLDGKLLGLARKEYISERPHPGWVEQDPELWWKKTIEAVSEAKSIAEITADQIAGIGVCGQGHSPTPIAKNGEVMHKCIHWSDRRAMEQVAWVKERLGQDYGNPKFTAVKLLWLKQHRPNIFESTYKFLLPTSFIVYKLTGEMVVDFTNALETDMYDPEAGDWSDTILATLGINRGKLPVIRDPWEVVGEVSSTAEHDIGLKTGTTVVVGGGDWACAEYGSGLVLPGRAVDTSGTSFSLAVAGKALRKMRCDTIVQDIATIANEVIGSSGAVYCWLRDELYLAESKNAGESRLNVDKLIDEEVHFSEPGLLLLPHFLYDYSNEWSRGRGLIYGISQSTTRGQIARAAMEGLAYEMKRRIWRDDKTGIEAESIRACGRASGSSIWRQIKADIFDVQYCRTNIVEAGCFGAAILAGVGCKIYPDLVSPIEKMVKIIDRNEPRKEYHEKYMELYQAYCRLSGLFEKSAF